MVKQKQTLGDIVRAARVAHLWTQAELASRAKVSEGIVARIESGVLLTVRPLTAAKLGATLEVDLKEFSK